ncbi:MAG: biopolymer transporter ExbD [bacterium]|nr:biopolymer transporter ExbD [bacterium]
MRRVIRYRRKRAAVVNDISLTPLIDTALTLLVIFMVAAPMMHNAIRVNLPKGQAKEDLGAQQELVVYVDKDGTIFLDGTKYNLTQLIKVLRGRVHHNQDKTVYVKADTFVSYGKVIELVDQIKVVGGIKYVALATQKRA